MNYLELYRIYDKIKNNWNILYNNNPHTKFESFAIEIIPSLNLNYDAINSDFKSHWAFNIGFDPVKDTKNYEWDFILKTFMKHTVVLLNQDFSSLVRHKNYILTPYIAKSKFDIK